MEETSEFKTLPFKPHKMLNFSAMLIHIQFHYGKPSDEEQGKS